MTSTDGVPLPNPAAWYPLSAVWPFRASASVVHSTCGGELVSGRYLLALVLAMIVNLLAVLSIVWVSVLSTRPWAITVGLVWGILLTIAWGHFLRSGEGTQAPIPKLRFRIGKLVCGFFLISFLLGAALLARLPSGLRWGMQDATPHVTAGVAWCLCMGVFAGGTWYHLHRVESQN